MGSLGISDFALSTCLLGARIDINVEDNVIALALAECPPRPYTELIKSDIPCPSSLRSARSTVLRPSPPSTMKISLIGPSAAKPTKGELLARLETMSWKPWSVKRKTLLSKVEELKRKNFETGGDGDSLLLDVELTAGVVSSILKDSDLKRSSMLPVDEALALSLQGVASVIFHTLSCLILVLAEC